MDYKDLVKDFKEDKNNFNKIYKKLNNSLKYFIFKYVNNEDATSDILSNTFYKIYDKIDSYNEELSEFNTWCFAIAKNECLNYLKRKKKYVSLDMSLSHDGEDFTLNDVLKDDCDNHKLDEHNLQKLYSEVIDLLKTNPINYEIVMYKYVQKLTNLEIVDKINAKHLEEYNKIKTQCDLLVRNSPKHKEYSLRKQEFISKNMISESFVKNHLLKTEEKLSEYFKKYNISDFINI